MELKLNDNEIRLALADALANKVNYAIPDINPEDCWFEVDAGNVDCNVEDIHNVKFCYKTE